VRYVVCFAPFPHLSGFCPWAWPIRLYPVPRAGCDANAGCRGCRLSRPFAIRHVFERSAATGVRGGDCIGTGQGHGPAGTGGHFAARECVPTGQRGQPCCTAPAKGSGAARAIGPCEIRDLRGASVGPERGCLDRESGLTALNRTCLRARPWVVLHVETHAGSHIGAAVRAILPCLCFTMPVMTGTIAPNGAPPASTVPREGRI
jgi:hypothetical protein